jgi:methylated-DNA-[protein]-cysteine S-methyltransferase
MTADTSTRIRYCVFDTAIGACGIAWSERGVTHFALPESDAVATERRLAARTAGVRTSELPGSIRRIVEDVQCYAKGERVDFSPVIVDLADIDDFRLGLYRAIRSLGWGETASYGEIGRRIGTSDARRIGQAMGQNRIPLIIPCHRVVASDGTLGGFSAPGGRFTKERLLTLEGRGADAPRLPGF